MKNLNTKTNGYYEIRDDGGIISAFAQLVNNGKAERCKCCGKSCNNYFLAYYIDDDNDEVCNIYGTECFKKIAKFDDSIIAL